MGKVGGDTTTYQVKVEADLGPLKALQEEAQKAAQAMRSMASGAGSGMSTVASGAGAALSALASVAGAALDAGRALAGMAAEGAKLNTMEAAFKSLGSSGEDLKKLRELTGGLVSDADLMEAFNLAKLFKLPAEEVPKLIKLAQGASAALGTTTAKALQDTFTAASRQSKMIADNMGIVIGDMGKMYDDYAKKRGKSAKDLTDQERQLAFIQKMISEGGRQMELANIAQGNAAAKAAASYENFTNNLKKSVAEMFGSMGIWETLGGVVGALEGALSQGGSTIRDVFGGAIKSAMGIIGTLADALSPAIMSLEGLGKALHILSGLLKVVAPAVKVLLFAFQELSSFLLDVVSYALEAVIRSGASVVGLLDEDMARSLNAAADDIAKARDVSLELGKSFDGVGVAAQGAVPKVDELGAAAAGAAQGVAGAMGGLPFELRQLQIEMDKLQTWGGMGVSDAKMRDMAGTFKWLASQAQASGMTAQAAQREAAEQIAKQWGMSSGKTKEAADAIIKTYGAIVEGDKKRTADAWAEFERRSAVSKAEEKRAKDEAIAKMRAFEAMYADAYEQGSEFATLTDDIWLKAANDEKAAAEELEAWRTQMLAQAAAAYGQGTEQYAQSVAQISDTTARAFEAMALGERKDDKGGKGGGKSIDWAKRDFDVRLALADEHQRAVMETERRYQEMVKDLRKGDSESRLALAEKMNADLLQLEEDRDRARQEAAFKLSTYFMSQSAAEKAARIREIQAEAEEMRRIARDQGADTGAIDIRERELIGEENAKGGLFAGMSALGRAQTDMWAAYRQSAQERQNEAEEEAKAHTERMAGLFQNMGTSIADTFVSVAIAGGDMREQTFKLMGSLFGQLSTAFLAWATAEGSLLAGNPFAAAAAAIALGAVGSAISAFGSRGKQGGASGGTASLSRSALERKRDEREKDSQVVIYNYGFATPDQIARSVTRGDMRGRDLDGRDRRPS